LPRPSQPGDATVAAPNQAAAELRLHAAVLRTQGVPHRPHRCALTASRPAGSVSRRPQPPGRRRAPATDAAPPAQAHSRAWAPATTTRVPAAPTAVEEFHAQALSARRPRRSSPHPRSPERQLHPDGRSAGAVAGSGHWGPGSGLPGGDGAQLGNEPLRPPWVSASATRGKEGVGEATPPPSRRAARASGGRLRRRRGGGEGGRGGGGGRGRNRPSRPTRGRRGGSRCSSTSLG
jgi:hypothetical protein